MADTNNEETADSMELAANELVGIPWLLLLADASNDETVDSRELV